MVISKLVQLIYRECEDNFHDLKERSRGMDQAIIKSSAIRYAAVQEKDVTRKFQELNRLKQEIRDTYGPSTFFYFTERIKAYYHYFMRLKLIRHSSRSDWRPVRSCRADRTTTHHSR